MQVIEATTSKHILKKMIVLKIEKTKCICLYVQKAAEPWPLQYNERYADLTLEQVMQQNQPRTIKIDGQQHAYEYVTVDFCCISRFFTYKIDMQHLRFISNNQLNEKQLEFILRNYLRVKEFKEEQIVNSKGQSKLKKTTESQQNTIRDILESTCHRCELGTYHITQFDKYLTLNNQMEAINKVLSGGVSDKEKDFNDRNEILQDYKMIDAEQNPLFRGKVCTKCKGDLLMTEFFFSGHVSSLSDLELLATLSLFCTNQKANNGNDCSKIYSDAFEKAINFIWDEAEKLIAKEKEKGIQGEEDTPDKRLNMKFYEMVYDWADQKNFCDVTQDCSIDEGIVVQLINSVNRKRQDMQEMATLVGDNSLAQRLKEMESLIVRGIFKMQSLYLEVEQEPPKLVEMPEMAEVNYEVK